MHHPASRDQQFWQANLHREVRSAFAKTQPQHLSLVYRAVLLNSPVCTAHGWWWPHVTFSKPLLISSFWMLNSLVQLSPLQHTIIFQALPTDKNIHRSVYLELRKQPYPKIPKTLDISTETWINTHGQFFYCNWKSSRYAGIWQVADWSLPEVLTGTCESLPLWTQHVFI